MSSKPGILDFAAQNARTAELLRDTQWSEVATFIGPNAETFRPTWDEMLVRLDAGKGVLIWGLCWPAWIFGFAWFFYRRLWLGGIALLVIPTVLGLAFDKMTLSLAAMIAMSMYARSYYLMHAIKRIAEVKARAGSEAEIAKAGGISMPGGIVGGLLFALGLAGTIAALFVKMPA